MVCIFPLDGLHLLLNAQHNRQSVYFFVFFVLWHRADFWTYNCFWARVNVQHPNERGIPFGPPWCGVYILQYTSLRWASVECLQSQDTLRDTTWVYPVRKCIKNAVPTSKAFLHDALFFFGVSFFGSKSQHRQHAATHAAIKWPLKRRQATPNDIGKKHLEF